MLSNSKNIFQENSADRGAFLMQLLKLDGPLLFLISLRIVVMVCKLT